MLVNFVVGGTQKGGTSALHEFLRQHPEICMPSTTKELHFFDNDEAFATTAEYDGYHAQFAPGPGHRAIGEATPIYMYWDPAPLRIRNYNPRMKWIIILRNPVHRAFSAWNMEKLKNNEDLSFENAIAWEPLRIQAAHPRQNSVFSYCDRGYYTRQIRRIYDLFGRENCLVILNEDLGNHHNETLSSIFRFLDVAPDFRPAPQRVHQNHYTDQLDPAIHRRLTARFHPDIKELEHLIGRDLSAWLS